MVFLEIITLEDHSGRRVVCEAGFLNTKHLDPYHLRAKKRLIDMSGPSDGAF